MPICAALCLTYFCVIFFHSQFRKMRISINIFSQSKGHFPQTGANNFSSSLFLYEGTCSHISTCHHHRHQQQQKAISHSVFMSVDLSIFSLVNQHLFCWSEFFHTHTNFGMHVSLCPVASIVHSIFI